jgi:leader peptidase (prepilin peptidase)/N-methyltransferase
LDELPYEFKMGLAIVLGLIVGSFLNVVIHRLPLDQSVVRPGSRCPKCKRSIPWYENIPVLSWLALRAKCGGCKAPIPFRYPFVELLTALLFALTVAMFGLNVTTLLRDLPWVAALIAVIFIDLDHRIIPDEISLGGLAVGLLTSVLDPRLTVVQAFVGAGVGFGVFFGFSWLYYKLTGRIGLGGGDVKLLAMLGAYLGLQGVFFTIFLSSIVGSVVGIALALAQRNKEKGAVMQFALPYGPFLVLGAFLYYYLGETLWLPFMTPM